MTQDIKPPQDSPFARWSRLKREAARAKEEQQGSADEAPTDAAAPPATATPSPEVADSSPRGDALPPLESLSFESDFAPFFQPQVDAALQRKALKQLLRDPHFNVMDGLDIYIGDYSQPDPIAPEIVRQMVQGRYIFDPPPTRINPQGHVEDVPPEELAALRQAKEAKEAKEAEEAKEVEALASSEAAPAIADTALEPDQVRDAEDPPAAGAADALSVKDDPAR